MFLNETPQQVKYKNYARLIILLSDTTHNVLSQPLITQCNKKIFYFVSLNLLMFLD